jgi:[NiFe] hydrogenase assembly HybE family chaperone
MISNGRQNDDVEHISRLLTDAFERIQRERMTRLPILHPCLSVTVVGAREWQGDWLGVLITPWCMNLVLVPRPGSVHAPGPTGATQFIGLPAGRYELIASAADGIGPFAACSLHSPMSGFADHASAVAAAEAVIAELFEPTPCPSDGERRASPGRSGLSRRDLLRGNLRRGH